jgi:hypothetical protein
MGSYILTAIAVGAVIGIYIYWRSNSNTNTGGPGGDNLPLDPNGIRPRWISTRIPQTDLHNNNSGLGISRRARAAFDRRTDLQDNAETGDTISIIKPVWKGIKFCFVLVSNAVIGLAAWTQTGLDNDEPNDNRGASGSGTNRPAPDISESNSASGGNKVFRTNQESTSDPTPLANGLETSSIVQSKRSIDIPGLGPVTQNNVLSTALGPTDSRANSPTSDTDDSETIGYRTPKPTQTQVIISRRSRAMSRIDKGYYFKCRVSLLSVVDSSLFPALPSPFPRL